MKRISLILTTLALFVSCGHNANRIHTLETEEFGQTIKEQRMPLVDVRSAEEYAEGHLAGAVNVDVNKSDFADWVSEMGDTVAVYCLRGGRSLKAAKLLAAKGIVVYNLAGGITEWQNSGGATTKD